MMTRLHVFGVGAEWLGWVLMRILYFFLAAIFSVLAIALRFLGQPTWAAVLAIMVAAVFLVLGFVQVAKSHEPEPVVLDEGQRETIRRMKAEGNHEIGRAHV